MKNSPKLIAALSASLLFLQFGTFAQTTSSSNNPLVIANGVDHAKQGQALAMVNHKPAQQPLEYLKQANEAESKSLIPVISVYQDLGDQSLHLFNPEKSDLSVEVKAESGMPVEGWLLESFAENDIRQTLQVSELKSGVYWLEVSAPNRQMVSIKWKKQ